MGALPPDGRAIGDAKEIVMDRSKIAVGCDVINLILGIFLFFSPWILSFAPGAESWNAWVCGAVIAGLAIAALSAFVEWEEWLISIVGIWIIVSPWILQFSGNSNAMRTHVIVGALVVVFAAIEIWLTYQAPPRAQTR